jgi:hypothetical protein
MVFRKWYVLSEHYIWPETEEAVDIAMQHPQAHNAIVSSTSSFGGFGATLSSGAIFLGRIRTFSPAAAKQ